MPPKALYAQPNWAIVVGQIVRDTRQRMKFMFVERKGLAVREAIRRAGTPVARPT